MSLETHKYWAFISYSHQDKAWGDWLHKALETYRVPKRLVGRASRDGTVPKRLFPIFRDREELPTSSDLGSNINEALKASRYLIVICSPKSAVSRWVNEEVKSFKALGREDRILCLIVDGEPNASDNPNSGQLECFPEALRYRVDGSGQLTQQRTEPIAADAREEKDGKGDARLKILAGLLGVSFDELRQRERRRRFWYRVQWSAASLILLGVIGGTWTWQERQKLIERYIEQGRQEMLGIRPLAGAVYLSEAYSIGGTSIALRFLLARAMEAVGAPAVVLDGHTDEVFSAEFSPDGKRAVTASNDGTAIVWDVERGNRVAVLKGHAGGVRHAVFSPDGNRILTGGGDGTAMLWSAGDGKLMATMRGHTGVVWWVAFNDHGRALTLGTDQTVRVWSMEGRLLTRIDNRQGELFSARFSPDGKRIATAGKLGASIWDSGNGRLIASLSVHRKDVTSAEFSEDGTAIVTAGADGTAKVWNSANGKLLSTLEGHKYPINTAFFGEGGARIVTAGNDGTVRVWDCRIGVPDPERWTETQAKGWDGGRGRMLVSFGGHGGKVWDARFNRNRSRVLSYGEDKSAKVWDIASGRLLASIDGDMQSARLSPDGLWILLVEGRNARVQKIPGLELRDFYSTPPSQSVSFSPDDKRVAAVRGNTVTVTDVSGNRTIATLTGHAAPVKFAVFARDGKRILTVGRDKAAKVWSLEDGKLLASLPGDFETAALSPDDSRVATGGGEPDRTVRIWDAGTGKQLAVLEGFEYAVKDVEFNANGSRLLTSGGKLWDAATGRLVASFSSKDSLTVSLKFSPDGNHVLSKDFPQHRLRIWSASTGELRARLEGHSEAVPFWGFSADGKQVLTASFDRTAKVWDAATGRVVASLEGHRNWVIYADFRADAKQVVTVSNDKSVRIWDAETGKTIRTLAGVGDDVLTAQFGPDSTLIMTSNANHTVRLWEAGTGALLETLAFGSSSAQTSRFDILRFSARFSADGENVIAYGATVWGIGLESRRHADIAALVKCRVPWRLQDSKLVPATPDPAACPKAASAR